MLARLWQAGGRSVGCDRAGFSLAMGNCSPEPGRDTHPGLRLREARSAIKHYRARSPVNTDSRANPPANALWATVILTDGSITAVGV